MNRVGLALVAIPALAVLGCAAILFTSTFPAFARAEEVEAEIANLRSEAEEGAARARDVEEFLQGEVLAIRSATDFIESRVGTATRPPEFYPVFAKLAMKAGIRVRSLTAQADQLQDPEAGEGPDAPADLLPDEEGVASAAPPPLFSTIPFALRVEGPPERILDFIGLLHGFRWPISVTRVEVSRHERTYLASTAEIRANVLIRRSDS